MEIVGAAAFDLRPVVRHVTDYCSFVGGASERLVVTVQDADISAVAAQGMEQARTRWRDHPGVTGNKTNKTKDQCNIIHCLQLRSINT